MKNFNLHAGIFRPTIIVCLILILTAGINKLMAQDSTEVVAETAVPKKNKPIKNTFESIYIIDNQTVIVPIKKTFEMDLQHRFGVVSNGYKDLFGLTGGINIRIGFDYVPIDKLMVGIGLTTDRKQWDGNVKYALFHQSAHKGGWPVSITYFGDMAIDTRGQENFVNFGDRISYFNQILIARKFTNKISIQVAPSLSHFNNVEGYIDSKGDIQSKMKNDHFAIAFSGRYKITEKSSIILNYDQPLTQHPTNNPHPNIAFGLETTTSSHAFQVFAGNYNYILQQNNNFYNQNDYTKGQFLIGFNITKLWNY
jgi:uncharacterized beta barrel domain-containing protein DUF5777